MRLASTRTTFLRNHGTVKDPSGCICIYIYIFLDGVFSIRPQLPFAERI